MAGWSQEAGGRGEAEAKEGRVGDGGEESKGREEQTVSAGIQEADVGDTGWVLCPEKQEVALQVERRWAGGAGDPGVPAVILE